MSTLTAPTHQTVRLVRGKHSDPRGGACVMELASMLAGEPFSDRPVSVCPVIAAFLRAYNDLIDDRRRQDLYRLAALSVGTRSSRKVQEERANRCFEVARELSARGGLNWLRRRGLTPAHGVALDGLTWRVARILRSCGDAGHVRALALVEELVAIGSGAPATTEPVATEPAASEAPATLVGTA